MAHEADSDGAPQQNVIGNRSHLAQASPIHTTAAGAAEHGHGILRSVRPHPHTTATTHQISPDLQPTCGRTPPRAEAKSLAAHPSRSPLPQPPTPNFIPLARRCPHFYSSPRLELHRARPHHRSRRAPLGLPPQFSPFFLTLSQGLPDGLITVCHGLCLLGCFHSDRFAAESVTI